MSLHLRRQLAELKRRKVYHVGAAYVVVAFVVWQAADIAFPSLGLSPVAITFVLAVSILGFPLALILAWAYEVRPEERDAALVASASAPIVPPREEAAGQPLVDDRAIAVLPFQNMSAEPESEYFADGITEELTHALARIRGLRVAARTSAFAFKGRHEDIRAIARALDVQHVIEGSVRRSDGVLRVTIQLIDARRGYHLWSERYERPLGEVFRVQDEIVEAVTSNLLSRLPAEAVLPDAARTQDLTAYDHYLRGRHLQHQFAPGAVAAAERAFEDALRRDPGFAPAHAALAEILCLQAVVFGSAPPAAIMPRARAAAERALELAPDLAEGHLGRGVVRFFHDWDFPAARRDLERAVLLSPSAADAHLWLEFYWTYAERDYDRAMAAIGRAMALDPLGRAALDRRATVQMIFGNYADAEADFRRVVEEGTAVTLGALGLADTLARVGRLQEAAEWSRRALEAEPRPSAVLGVVGGVLALAGRVEEARQCLRELEGRQEDGYVPAFWLAAVHAGLGHLDEAFRQVDRAVEARDGNLLYLSVVPRRLGLHADPRYASALRRIGLGHLVPRLEAPAS